MSGCETLVAIVIGFAIAGVGYLLGYMHGQHSNDDDSNYMGL